MHTARLLLVIGGMLLLPGWAFLAVSNAWRKWEGLQRWIVAIGLSISFYPIFFYSLRFLLPKFTLGPYKLGTLLVIFAIVILWRLHDAWKEIITFDHLELAALTILGMTIFSRLWVIRDLPYPAWSDSLHHTLLTQLTAVQGHLPTSLEPYFPIPLDQYHLGLYAFSATVQWLAQVPAHTALLWTGQVLNGLCGIGVYYVLARNNKPWGALVGLLTVGLLAHQPAFYVNWGRFTQISSQAVMLIAWGVLMDTLQAAENFRRDEIIDFCWLAIVTALLSVGVFLLHFRVVAFYLILAFIGFLATFVARREQKTRLRLIGTGVIIAVIFLVLITPVLFPALRVYISTRIGEPQPVVVNDAGQSSQDYYEFGWESVPVLVAKPWLLLLAGLSAIWGLVWKREKLILWMLVWCALLTFVGSAYFLKIRLLNFTNLGAVLIMLYLPLGVIIGVGADLLCAFLQRVFTGGEYSLVLLLLLCGFIGGSIRVIEIEPYRYFVTADDVEAMRWINANTPSEARFAINTYFWLPQSPHGTDAGYWIPYFTGRKTTAGCMLNPLASAEYQAAVITMSRAADEAETTDFALEAFKRYDIDYVYIGAKGDFSGAGLDAQKLIESGKFKPVYRNERVIILEVQY